MKQTSCLVRLLVTASTLLGACTLVACGGEARDRAVPIAPNDAPPAEAPRPSASSASPFAGLKPCSKDEPDGGAGCAAGPAKTGAPSQALAGKDTVWNVPISSDDPAKGAADPLVVVVVFSDFQCPFCKVATETFDKLVADYPNDLKLVWKDLPLPAHEHAESAAELARAARAAKGDSGFWAAHDLLYESQSSLGDATYRKIAEKLGLPWSATEKAIHEARYGAVIHADVALSDRIDVPATPTLFVNGRQLVGAVAYEKIRALVDEELTKARALEAGGTPRKAIYDHIIAHGAILAKPSDVPP
jgi:protein-disulfide isomerase